MKASSESGNTLQFIVIAVLLLVTVNLFVYFGKKAFEKNPYQKTPAETIVQEEGEELSYVDVFDDKDHMKLSMDKIVEKPFLHLPYPALIFANDKLSDKSNETIGLSGEIAGINNGDDLGQAASIKDTKNTKEFTSQKPDTEWQKYAVNDNDNVKPLGSGTRNKIVIIIDDLGLGYDSTAQINALPGPLTLAYLPYARNLYAYTKLSKDRGHELLIHTPMEPLNASLDVGPAPLLKAMEEADFKAALNNIFDSFEGYVGINNHMGSKLTQDPQAMKWVMESLRERGLLFVDSKTIHTSIAFDVAREHGLYHAQRDVFIAHEPDIEFVHKSLEQVELIARNKGYAIAIGHPRQATIAALREWLPTLEAKGFELVPVSAVVRNPDAILEKQELPEVKLTNIDERKRSVQALKDMVLSLPLYAVGQ